MATATTQPLTFDAFIADAEPVPAQIKELLRSAWKLGANEVHMAVLNAAGPVIDGATSHETLAAARRFLAVASAAAGSW